MINIFVQFLYLKIESKTITILKVYSRTLKTPHYKLAEMMNISLRIHDISAKNIFEQKRTISLLKFHTKPETSTPVIYVIQYDFKR